MPEILTPAERAELETLYAMTPEIWTFDKRSVRIDDLLETGDIGPTVGVLHVYRMRNPKRREAIGRFIVAAHNTFPRLMATVLALEAENTRLRQDEKLLRADLREANALVDKLETQAKGSE